jgi:murein DD-endopeptidase MepM/ murein hydrolase activator NlpD
MLTSSRMLFGAAIMATTAYVLMSMVDLGAQDEYAAEAATATAPAAPSAYGIPLSGYVLERGTVRKGDTFGGILAAHGVDAQHIDSLARASEPTLDVDKLMADRPYALIFKNGEERVPAYFVYEKDLAEHAIFSLRSPIAVRMAKRPVKVEQRSLSVGVSGALWSDLEAAGADPSLAMELAQVYQWTVDFYRIQPGDSFTVAYEQRTVDGLRYGAPQVRAARYQKEQVAKEAFLFTADGTPAFFDGDGNSLRKAFLKAPLRFSRMTSGYSRRRFHPVQKRYKPHLGTDYAAPYGTPILAVGDGVVENEGYTAGNGNYVKIKHNGTYSTQYLHMRRTLVRHGQYVHQGQVIGEVGSTGLATGPHVCFRFWKHGVQVDHRAEELPSAEPVPANVRTQFLATRDQLRAQLDQARRAQRGEVIF